MATLFFDQALLPDGWAANVRLRCADGLIESVEVGAAPHPAEPRHAIGLPGLPNLHSHSFQRGMAGLSERRGPGTDSFWTWREVMYRFLAQMTPEDVEAIAALAFAEMLEAGFTRVGEFHYLHHQPDGAPYAAAAEMATRIAAAAEAAAIQLTLLPCFYAHGNFGGAAPSPGQRRFLCDLDGFAKLLAESRAAIAQLPGSALGIAPHSLRAVTPGQLHALLAMMPDGPVHLHAAEQVREVEDCIAWSGSRPVAYLLRHFVPDQRWCLIHATHMTEAETTRLAATGAVAGLCPITEASLGDGIFNGAGWVGAAGRYGIGTDSNILIDAADELRQLEYAQRLARQARNVMAGGTGFSTGRTLFETALSGGGQALGQQVTGLRPGAPADAVTLRRSDCLLADLAGDKLLDMWIFAGRRLVDSVFVRGRAVVIAGEHIAKPAIARRYAAAIRRLTQ